MWLMKIVTRAKPRQKSISLGARMVYAKTFSRPATRHGEFKVEGLPRRARHCSSRARLPRSMDFGKAARGGHTKPVRSARRAPDNGDFVGVKTYLSHGVCGNSESRRSRPSARSGHRESTRRA